MGGGETWRSRRIILDTCIALSLVSTGIYASSTLLCSPNLAQPPWHFPSWACCFVETRLGLFLVRHTLSVVQTCCQLALVTIRSHHSVHCLVEVLYKCGWRRGRSMFASSYFGGVRTSQIFTIHRLQKPLHFCSVRNQPNTS
jgi:hypothetical protein